jgi:hypothetical protein
MLMRYILFILLLVCFYSCSKEDKPGTTNEKQTTTEQNRNNLQLEENQPADTNLTPEEKFSASIMEDFLDSSDDEDLQGFLEDEVFKNQQGYTGAAVIGLTPSTWLLALEKDNSTKNYMIQKFVDFKTNEYYFRMNETSLKINDVIAGGKTK